LKPTDDLRAGSFDHHTTLPFNPAVLAAIYIHEVGRVYDSANFANVIVIPSLLILDY
jgi:hypothetical protein